MQVAQIQSIEDSSSIQSGPFISIQNLVVDYWTEKKDSFRAVDDVSFDVYRGEVLGLAGESGSGKSTIANAILRLIDPPSKVSGKIMIGTSNILRLDSKQTREYRWKLVAMVFQGAMNSLDPVFSVSSQVIETIKAHDPVISNSDARSIALELFRRVGIDPERSNDYPHQLSGGMRQRVMIAMALALRPKLLIADEPTSDLDVVTQKQIMSLLRHLRAEYNLSVLFITHDLPLLSQICDRIAVMQRGKIVEIGSKEEILHEPKSDYTKLLIRSVPNLKGTKTALPEFESFNDH